MNLTTEGQALLAAIGHPVLRESVRDTMVSQQFRRDVFVKGGRPMSSLEQLERYRSIVLFRKGEKSFFVYGFPKSELGNIREDEQEQFKKMAKHVLALTDAQLSELIANGQFEEVARDG